MDFKNKNVIITGGSTGIGFATAKAFIKEGADVIITSRSNSNLQKAAEEINSPQLKTLVSDTSNLEGIQVLEKYIADNAIKIDVLYLNAAVATFSPIENTLEEDFDMQFNTNVKGLYFTLQKLIPYLADGASVLLTSSIVATASNVGTSVYSATKAAINAIGRIAANELGDRNIRVNMISPGPITTPGSDKALDEKGKEHLASATILKRFGFPEEIAGLVLFVASEKGSFITGTELLADGGYLTKALR